MPPVNRSEGRDVHIYDSKDRTTMLGGLILSPGVTNANFYSMVEVFVLFTVPFSLQNEGSIEIKKDQPSASILEVLHYRVSTQLPVYD